MSVYAGGSTPVVSGGVLDFAAVTPSDGTPLDPVPFAVYVGVAGNVALKSSAGVSAIIPAAAGKILGISPQYVMATETTATGLVGFYRQPVSVAPPIAPATFSMTQLSQLNRIYQRSTSIGGGQGKGAGAIPVTVSVSQAGAVYARIRDADGSTILQSSFLVSSNVATGSQTLNIAGVDARLGWFYVDLSGDGSTWQNGTVLVGMGRLIAIAGQSLAVRFLQSASDTTKFSALGIAPNANTSIYAGWAAGGTPSGYTPSSWQAPSDSGPYTSAFALQYLNWQTYASGVNCGMIGYAVGQSASSTWLSGQTNNTNLLNILAQAGGAFEAFIWMQGHSDSQAGVSYATYQSNLANIFGTITAANSRSYEKYIASIPFLGTTAWGTPAQVATIRQASNDYATSIGASYIQAPDLTTAEGVHQTQLGAIRLALHFHRASRPVWGLSGTHLGPLITGITRASTNGGNALLNLSSVTSLSTPSRSDVWMLRMVMTVHGDNNLWTPPPYNSAAATGWVDPALDAAFDVTFESSQVSGTDGSISWVMDGSPYADEIAMNAVAGNYPISVGRPLVYPYATISTSAPLSNVTYNLTMTGSPAYTTTGQKFGTAALSAGYGTNPNVPSYPNSTVELWCNLATPTARAVVLDFGGRGYIGHDASGNLQITVSDSVTTTTHITDSTWHHIELDITPTGWTVFVDGALIQTHTVMSKGNGGLASVRNYTNGALPPAAGGIIDEVAIWQGVRHTTAFTPPTSPYVGNETGLVALYHLDSNGNDSCVN